MCSDGFSSKSLYVSSLPFTSRQHKKSYRRANGWRTDSERWCLHSSAMAITGETFLSFLLSPPMLRVVSAGAMWPHTSGLNSRLPRLGSKPHLQRPSGGKVPCVPANSSPKTFICPCFLPLVIGCMIRIPAQIRSTDHQRSWDLLCILFSITSCLIANHVLEHTQVYVQDASYSVCEKIGSPIVVWPRSYTGAHCICWFTMSWGVSHTKTWPPFGLRSQKPIVFSVLSLLSGSPNLNLPPFQ